MADRSTPDGWSLNESSADCDTGLDWAEARRAIEAILLVATDPVSPTELAQILEVPLQDAIELCHELAITYLERNHGFQLVEVAGGWRYQTHTDMAEYVERFATDASSPKLSNAALETLSIVAYKQPISRAQLSAIRGVNVDGVLRTLVQRGYAAEVGRDDGAGQAVLFGTTKFFLERLGLNSLEDLPALGEFVPSAAVVEALEMTLKVDIGDEPNNDDGSHNGGVEPSDTPAAGENSDDDRTI